jgi:hypothetical protein
MVFVPLGIGGRGRFGSMGNNSGYDFVNREPSCRRVGGSFGVHKYYILFSPKTF